MDYQPVVSVITIVYNGEKHITSAIQSVINQSYPHIEYIVIDGGSTDNTVGVIKQYEQQIAAWISEKDNGISDAFNKGIQRATGDIIGILNADDWYEKDTIEQVVQCIRDHDIVYGDMRMWREGKKDFIVKGNHALLEKEMTVNHPTVFVKKACYDKLGLFDTGYKCAMDYDLMLRFAINKASFHYIPAVLTNMRWEGLSDTRWLLGCRETLSIKNKYLPHRRFRNQLYYVKHVLAIAITKYLNKGKLAPLVRMYRSRFSKVEKVYE